MENAYCGCDSWEFIVHRLDTCQPGPVLVELAQIFAGDVIYETVAADIADGKALASNKCLARIDQAVGRHEKTKATHAGIFATDSLMEPPRRMP
jgi:hypothetical protein